jgi:predicted transport protein
MADKSNPAAETANMIANLEKSTGKTMPEWVEIAKSSGLEKHGEILKFLQTQHGLSYGYANIVVHTLRGSAADMVDDRDALVEAHYAKGKEHLRPIYDKLVEIISGFGDDIELVPMKAYVSVRRNKQFACIQPTTKTRMDVGIKMKKGYEPTERLLEGGFNGMVSHLVKVSDIAEVDDELVSWLKQAYESA